MERKKILVIEDEEAMRKMLAVELEAAGYVVGQAADGQEALDKMQKDIPHLIISDVLMPRMDGFTFYKKARNDPGLKDVPILILTARGKMEDTFKVVGVEEFIAKPFKSEELLEKVRQLITRAELKDALQGHMRVLIAGDTPEVVQNMVSQLQRIGCEAETVLKGAEIIGKLVMFLPQIIIMEVLMEGITVPDILRVIRQMPHGAQIPIILYTHYRLSDLGSEDVRQRVLSIDAAEKLCLEAGATAYIGRFNESSFLKDIKRFLTVSH